MNRPTLIRRLIVSAALLVLLVAAGSTFAQETTPEPAPPLPAAFQLEGFRYQAQTWNNCGPATLTMALSFFGYQDDQQRAADWLKPNYEDKNVSPWQMEAYVDTQVPEVPVFAEVRYGGTLDTLKTLIYNRFVVIIEMGYDPPRAAQGWMGHYLLVKGWDDGSQVFTSYDSYDGENLNYSYEHIQQFWEHFNYVYLVLYDSGREAELFELLGDNADRTTNIYNAYSIAYSEAVADQTNAFAWFNLGSNFTMLEMYDDAATAFDVARNTGNLPWRMLWYQFGPYIAYNAVGRYDDTLALANTSRNDGGGQYVEETFYYAGVAREGLGEIDRARDNFQEALTFNPNFTPARDALAALNSSGG